MTAKKEKKISLNRAKKDFSFAGKSLLFYVLMVLILPHFLREFFVYFFPEFIADRFIYLGIFLIIQVVGTFIPFSLLLKGTDVSLKGLLDNVDASFTELFVSTVVMFSVVLGLTYVSNIILTALGIESNILINIGMTYKEVYFNSPLYLFMFIAVGPLLEEFVFRGVLLNFLSPYSIKFALYVSTILFALAHGSLSEILPAAAMGYLLGKTALSHRSIQPTIAIHILFNMFLALMFLVPSAIAQYISYAMTVLFFLAIYLILTGRYERVRIHGNKNNRYNFFYFFTRISVMLSIILMIAHMFIEI